MRELKFRAWDESLKQYFYDVAVYPNNIVAIQRHNIESMMLEANGMTHWTELDGNAIIEQYTGLKDKNGKEIYEGDIVEYSWDFCGIKCKNKYAVEWLSGYVEHYPCSFDSGFTLPDSVDGYMVIGNIHENPELLEKEK